MLFVLFPRAPHFDLHYLRPIVVVGEAGAVLSLELVEHLLLLLVPIQYLIGGEVYTRYLHLVSVIVVELLSSRPQVVGSDSLVGKPPRMQVFNNSLILLLLDVLPIKEKLNIRHLALLLLIALVRTEILQVFQHFLREPKHLLSKLKPGALGRAAETVIVAKFFMDIKGEEIAWVIVVRLGAERTAFQLYHSNRVLVLHLVRLQELLHPRLAPPKLERNRNTHKTIIHPSH